ncbi:unnamed protein product [Thlaspi arvense]|uniref:F-box/LRR-repeat protein n=1 Tax=Thlaspi arvense TaxID=13288 RepID=A0AAU9STE5_THLAR|nr:unnamed protein product [Thlaspi arvense]
MADVSQTKEMPKEMPKGNSEKSKKTDMADMAFIESMNDDLLHNILLRLPAQSFGSASCVSRSWNCVCNRILSRPKMISAFSRNPDKLRAGEEVLDKVLSEPIRPDFVIANISYGNVEETLRQITKRVGSRVPVIVSLVAGILGKEARNEKLVEINPYAVYVSPVPNFAILLTIGYLPGFKVDVIPAIQAIGESEATVGDKFVMDIRNFVSVVSDHTAPACLILFGEDTHATEPIIQKLDYDMPAETIIVGELKGQGDLVHKRANESRCVQLQRDESRVLAGLVFARDRHRPIPFLNEAEAGRIQFHAAISGGMSPVDLRYKAANVILTLYRWPATLLNAKRRGEAEVLNGEQILENIEETLVGNPSWENEPADEQYLTVDGAGIRTGDCFQVYFPDLKVAEASLAAVSSQLRNLESKPNKTEVVGGFVFAGSGRGDSFFGRPNANISPFLENFPELPFGGISCNGQIGRSFFVEEGEENKESSIRRCFHSYSSVYFIVSYTSQC